jgi:hypothetical protein
MVSTTLGPPVGPRSSCNCPTLSYKMIRQTPNSNKLNSSLNRLIHIEQYISSGRRVLCFGGLNHLKICMSTLLDPSNWAYERLNPFNNKSQRASGTGGSVVTLRYLMRRKSVLSFSVFRFHQDGEHPIHGCLHSSLPPWAGGWGRDQFMLQGGVIPPCKLPCHHRRCSGRRSSYTMPAFSRHSGNAATGS